MIAADADSDLEAARARYLADEMPLERYEEAVEQRLNELADSDRYQDRPPQALIDADIVRNGGEAAG